MSRILQPFACFANVECSLMFLEFSTGSGNFVKFFQFFAECLPTFLGISQKSADKKDYSIHRMPLKISRKLPEFCKCRLPNRENFQKVHQKVNQSIILGDTPEVNANVARGHRHDLLEVQDLPLQPLLLAVPAVGALAFGHHQGDFSGKGALGPPDDGLYSLLRCGRALPPLLP